MTSPNFVMLNLFQNPSCPKDMGAWSAQWTLKRIQGDDKGGMGDRT